MRQTKRDILSKVEKDVLRAKVVANNTLFIEYADGTSAYRLHDTDIITYQNDLMILNSGGWRTQTTRRRIEEFSGIRIRQEKGIWYVISGSKRYHYYDGITFDKENNVVSHQCSSGSMEKEKALVKKINKYIELLEDDFLPEPNEGDCWYCLFDWPGNEHLESHIEENYIPGSLVVNALRWTGYQDVGIAIIYNRNDKSAAKRALRRYMKFKLGLAY